jgi:uncharacterized membrane protein
VNEEEKAARLELYKAEAKAQWDARQRAQRTPTKFDVITTRWGNRATAAFATLFALYFVLGAAYNHRYWGIVALFVAVPLAVPLLKKIETGAHDDSETYWKLYGWRKFAVVLWVLLFVAVAAIAFV